MNYLRKRFSRPNSDRVEGYYSKWHEQYMKGFGDILQVYRTTNINVLLDHFIHNSGMQDGMRILDAGCGVGGCGIHFLTKKNVSLEGITISQEQAEAGIQNIKNNNLEGKFNIRQGDFHHLSDHYEMEKFDLIYFLESLVHSNRPDIVLRECSKVLKKGGLLYIKDIYEGVATTRKEAALIKTAVKNINRQFETNICHLDETLHILRRNNFVIIFAKIMNLQSDYSLGHKFVADNNILIYKNQIRPYDGIGPDYLSHYEIKAIKPYR